MKSGSFLTTDLFLISSCIGSSDLSLLPCLERRAAAAEKAVAQGGCARGGSGGGEDAGVPVAGGLSELQVAVGKAAGLAHQPAQRFFGIQLLGELAAGRDRGGEGLSCRPGADFVGGGWQVG